jgi:hypothetical protein
MEQIVTMGLENKIILISSAIVFVAVFIDIIANLALLKKQREIIKYLRILKDANRK